MCVVVVEGYVTSKSHWHNEGIWLVVFNNKLGDVEGHLLRTKARLPPMWSDVWKCGDSNLDEKLVHRQEMRGCIKGVDGVHFDIEPLIFTEFMVTQT